MMSPATSADVLLTAGSIVTVRPVAPGDQPALTDLYRRTTADALRLRFFTYSAHAAAADVTRLLRPQSDDHVALVVTQRDEVIGVGCVERTATRGTGELALLVDDRHHHEGVGTVLVEQLVVAARRAGFHRLHAEVLGENIAMLAVLRQLGADTAVSMSGGVVDVDFVLDVTPAWQLTVDRRESIAEYASLERVLAPKSIAVIGAGSAPDGIGHRILANLVDGGFTGELYAVNRSGATVCGIAASTTTCGLPAGLDLVIVAVPAVSVLGVIQDCAALGVGSAVVISDGFAEIDRAGVDQQAELLRVARNAGMRLVGPNCLGVTNSDPAIRLNATFADLKLTAGSTAVASQSGGVGLALLEHFADRGMGVSSFVSMGNKADVSGNDLLMRWEHDAQTEMCVLYLESFGNARKFARIARRVSRTKPIVAITAGRSVAGARGVRSHTAAAATPDVAIDALFAQAGVIRADGMADVFGIVELLRQKALPRGDRVGIVTNGGGPGALAADACAAAGLRVPELDPRTQRRLVDGGHRHAGLGNPVDVTAGGGPLGLASAATVLLDSDDVDSVILIHTSLSPTDVDDVATALANLNRGPGAKPLLAVFLGHDETPAPLRERSTDTGVACFAYPEAAASALAAVTAYAAWRMAPERPLPALRGIRRRTATRLVHRFLATHPDGGRLDTDAAAALVASYGIAVATSHRVESATEAVAAAEKTGYPVAIKAASGAVLHRTENNGVQLDLATAAEVTAAVEAIRRGCGAGPLVVQPMIQAGVEMAVGVVADQAVGPVVMLAMGGIATDLLADRSFRLPPSSRADVRDQVMSLRSSPLLTGYRGSQSTDVAGLEDLVLRVGQLALDVPELTDLDLNPVMVSPSGVVAVDVKVRLDPANPSQQMRQLARAPTTRS